MGFDLYGMNPQADTPCPEWTKDEPFRKVKGKKDEDGMVKEYEVIPELKKEYDKYMKAKWKWQEENDGAYFRNNVWFWRPLWNYVCQLCDEFHTDQDMEKGGWNDGHSISKTKARMIARRLRMALEEGHVELTEANWKKEQEELEDDDWDRNYPFNADNVRAFERFCHKSGGFQIC